MRKRFVDIQMPDSTAEQLMVYDAATMKFVERIYTIRRVSTLDYRSDNEEFNPLFKLALNVFETLYPCVSDLAHALCNGELRVLTENSVIFGDEASKLCAYTVKNLQTGDSFDCVFGFIGRRLLYSGFWDNGITLKYLSGNSVTVPLSISYQTWLSYLKDGAKLRGIPNCGNTFQFGGGNAYQCNLDICKELEANDRQKLIAWAIRGHIVLQCNKTKKAYLCGVDGTAFRLTFTKEKAYLRLDTYTLKQKATLATVLQEIQSTAITSNGRIDFVRTALPISDSIPPCTRVKMSGKSTVKVDEHGFSHNTVDWRDIHTLVTAYFGVNTHQGEIPSTLKKSKYPTRLTDGYSLYRLPQQSHANDFTPIFCVTDSENIVRLVWSNENLQMKRLLPCIQHLTQGQYKSRHPKNDECNATLLSVRSIYAVRLVLGVTDLGECFITLSDNKQSSHESPSIWLHNIYAWNTIRDILLKLANNRPKTVVKLFDKVAELQEAAVREKQPYVDALYKELVRISKNKGSGITQMSKSWLENTAWDIVECLGWRERKVQA